MENQDFIFNGSASGSVAQMLVNNGMSPRALRPYSLPGQRGTFITVNKDGKDVPELVSNANTTMTKEAWIELDTAVMKAARPLFVIVDALRARGLVRGVTNGMGTTVLQTQAQSDISAAQVSMDGEATTQKDRPEYSLVNLPLPIVHKDFSFSLREIEASKRGGMSLDTATAELAGSKVAEIIESLFAGTYGTYQVGGGNIYGLTNFTNRLTKSMSDPTATSWTGASLVADVIAMRKQCSDIYYNGPFMIFNAPFWDTYLDADYSTAKGDNTLRDRILRIKGIEGMVTVPTFTGSQFVLCQMSANVIRVIDGMGLTTVQWESSGGLRQNFKVMTIQVPQIRADFNSRCGLVHGAVA